MREMKQTMAAVLSLTLACTLLIAPAEGQAAKKKMKLNKTKATLYVGKKLTLKVKNTKKKVKWSSSKKAVASVTKKGVVKAKKAGTVKITAQVGSYKKVVTIKVRNASLKLAKTAATVKKGKTTTIKVSAVPTGKVTYTSSNKKVATVTSKGVVKGVKKGTATITVKCNGMTAKFKVTVK